MTLKGLSESKFFRPTVAATAAVLCGLGLWATTLGENRDHETIGDKWERASYDYLFYFGAPVVTNNIVLILMDNDSYTVLGQARPPGVWDRSLHAQLLNKLADDRCPLVICDVRFLKAGDAASDHALASAMQRLSNVVLAADMITINVKGADTIQPLKPLGIFTAAASANWGLTYIDPDPDSIMRRHWPFPSPGDYPTLPWLAATLSGARLSREPEERWLRYYNLDTAFSDLSYGLALTNQAPNYFHDKVVFIGNDPETRYANNHEPDKFNTPYTDWTEEGVGGVKILATAYLNLVRGDWLRRASWPMEGLLLIATGGLSGIVFSRYSRWRAIGVAALVAIFFSVAGIELSQVTNYWFPWLMVVGAQVPCALAVAVLVPSPLKLEVKAEVPQPVPEPKNTIVLTFPEDKPPDAPDYELLQPPIGEGSFGKVWIVRNAIGQWQALKAVYQSKFGANRHPYESEFRGLQKYKPVSEKHPGLLRIDLVSKMKDEGYFYYVMELGDAQVPGWESAPSTYKPRDLENMRKQSGGLPLAECIRIGTVLTDALSFLHSHSLTHRDIKPANVIFVNGRPKLADIGLVTDIRPPDKINTFVGTPGYMPPPPEPPGTPQADIYALGMVLYVISTGYDPKFFPDIATTIMERREHVDFVRFDAIILKACQPDVKQRYQAAADMLRDLEKLTAKEK
ncbi:MAG TPA: CHASE2 domain-containing protein [Candidatus Acidoferrales bacterium]|nr:CHASE2 domain-containing protein [Candidatus Acidoferrales bacterium]